jgi:hypothetical protein
MAALITIEIVGLKDSSCSPFPCDMTRSCGLYDCYPTGKLLPAYEALQSELGKEYGERVAVRLTLVDKEIPGYIREILESQYPPLPIILVNGKLTHIGRISLPLIQKEIEKVIS